MQQKIIKIINSKTFYISLIILCTAVIFTLRFTMLLKSNHPCGLDGYYYALQAKSLLVNHALENPDYKTGYYLCALTVTYKTDKYALNLNGSYVGKRYTSNANLYFMDPYFLLNASAQMNIQTENFIFTPYLKLSNILNTDYEAVENYPVPGISLTLGLKFGTQ